MSDPGPGGIISPLEFANSVPDKVAVCSNLQIGWFGGVPPYVVSYSPTNVPSTTTNIASGLPSVGFIWKVNAIPSSQITLNIVDSAGTAIHSTSLGVQSGLDTSCVNFSTTPGPTTSVKSTTTTNNPVTTSSQTSTTSASSSSSNTLTSGTSTQSSTGSSPTGSSVATSPSGSMTNPGLLTDSSSSSSSTTTESQTTLPNLNLDSGNTSSTPTGAIAGAVVGGIFVIIGLILFFLLLRNRRKRKIQKFGDKFDAEGNAVVPFQPESTVAPTVASSGFVTSGKGQLGSIPVVPAQSSLALNSKSREAQREQAPSPSDPQDSSTSNSSSSGPPSRPPQVLRHEDSGIRMPANESNVVELPPLYTPG